MPVCGKSLPRLFRLAGNPPAKISGYFPITRHPRPSTTRLFPSNRSGRMLIRGEFFPAVPGTWHSRPSTTCPFDQLFRENAHARGIPLGYPQHVASGSFHPPLREIPPSYPRHVTSPPFITCPPIKYFGRMPLLARGITHMGSLPRIRIHLSE